jgi:hypothetical protein
MKNKLFAVENQSGILIQYFYTFKEATEFVDFLYELNCLNLTIKEIN